MACTGGICPDCGSSSVVEDDLHSQTHMVCQDCGSVVSEGILTADRGEGSDVRYSETTAVAKQACKNQRKGLYRVRALCRILRLNPETEELAETYYKQAYEHPHFIRVTLVKKEALVGCCVLVSCRLRNYPVAMGTISCLLEADPMLMGVVYQDLVKTLKIEAPMACVSDILATHSQEYKISSSDVPEVLAESSGDLTKRAVALVELAADSWIVTGRRPLPIMMAAIFLAWQSLKPIRARLTFSLEKFCRLAKVPKNNTALKRISELKEVLCKLGTEIPWLVDDVSPDTVMKVTEDILQHRYALLRRALRTHEEALLSAPQPGELDTGSQGRTPSPTGAVPSQSPSDNTVTESCEPDAGSAEEPEGGGSDSSTEGPGPTPAPNWGKRLLFPPPCVRHAKVRRVESPAQPDVTGDEDISDSEIETYIRTPREAREFAATQKLLCSSGAVDGNVKRI